MSDSGRLNTIAKALRASLPRLGAEYGVDSLSVFGSVARGDARADSDVDLLVSFSGEPPGLFRFIELERELAEIVGGAVDLVMETALKPRLRDQILAEAVAA